MERLHHRAEFIKGVLVISLEGELDVYTLPKAREAIDVVLDSGIHAIVFNLAELEHLDSSAIGFFMELSKKFSKPPGVILFAAPSKYLSETLRLTKIDRVLKFKPTVHDAVTEVLYPPKKIKKEKSKS